ncbi:MAG: hypothetical protein KDJ39_06055 [Gammaproteobacteria bacterium]|nr:hypothetical protein [Gammaproteobacteria bacterium]
METPNTNPATHHVVSAATVDAVLSALRLARRDLGELEHSPSYRFAERQCQDAIDRLIADTGAGA